MRDFSSIQKLLLIVAQMLPAGLKKSLYYIQADKANLASNLDELDLAKLVYHEFYNFGQQLELLKYRIRVSRLYELILRASTILEREDKAEFKILINEAIPPELKNTVRAPRLLFWQGNLCRSALNIAVVGSRRACTWSQAQAFNIALELGQDLDIGLVSGLALGCDSAAHTAACITGKTNIAVLASGFDRLYPRENKDLAERILYSNGALCSEYMPSSYPRKWHFIERNRLQSALSSAVLLIESSIRGGAIHTVNFARRQRLQVFCLARPAEQASNSNFTGNDYLLETGQAKLWDAASFLLNNAGASLFPPYNK